MRLAVGLPELHPGTGSPIGAAFIVDDWLYPLPEGAELVVRSPLPISAVEPAVLSTLRSLNPGQPRTVSMGHAAPDKRQEGRFPPERCGIVAPLVMNISAFECFKRALLLLFGLQGASFDVRLPRITYAGVHYRDATARDHVAVPATKYSCYDS